MEYFQFDLDLFSVADISMIKQWQSFQQEFVQNSP